MKSLTPHTLVHTKELTGAPILFDGTDEPSILYALSLARKTRGIPFQLIEESAAHDEEKHRDRPPTAHLLGPADAVVFANRAVPAQFQAAELLVFVVPLTRAKRDIVLATIASLPCRQRVLLVKTAGKARFLKKRLRATEFASRAIFSINPRSASLRRALESGAACAPDSAEAFLCSLWV